MESLKWWLEFTAAIMTIAALPLVWWIFLVERRDRFHDSWVTQFRYCFTSGNVDKYISLFRAALEEAERPWRSRQRQIRMVVSAALDAADQKQWDREVAKERIQRYLALAAIQIDDSKQRKRELSEEELRRLKEFALTKIDEHRLSKVVTDNSGKTRK